MRRIGEDSNLLSAALTGCLATKPATINPPLKSKRYALTSGIVLIWTISRRIGEGVEPCNMPTKASLPMRPSIRLVTQMAAHLCYTQVRAHTFKGFLMQRYALFVQPERTEQNFYFFLYQLARYLSKGYVSMLASFAQYSLRKLPLVIIMS